MRISLEEEVNGISKPSLSRYVVKFVFKFYMTSWVVEAFYFSFPPFPIALIFSFQPPSTLLIIFFSLLFIKTILLFHFRLLHNPWFFTIDFLYRHLVPLILWILLNDLIMVSFTIWIFQSLHHTEKNPNFIRIWNLFHG